MSIHFTPARWQTIRENYTHWWNGTLPRPLIPVVVTGAHVPDRPCPAAPLLSQANCHDFSIPAEQIIDRIDYELSTRAYHGDAFPYFNMDCFGPGILAAFLGARVDNSTGRVWFHAPDDRPIADLHLAFDPDNPWFLRLRDLYAAAMARWQGQVLMGMTDLGGCLDILSTFRPGETLLLDLYDDPDEVRRLLNEIHTAWFQAYDALNAVLQPANPGYSDWSRIYSDRPSYIPQCDFCYMISTDMFNEFALPQLADTFRRLDRSIYHLDGVGQLAHLDTLLADPNLDAVQWVPGAGQPDHSHWPEVHQKIIAAGKRMQLNSGVEDGFTVLDTVVARLGAGCGIHVSEQTMTPEQFESLRGKLNLE